MSHTKINRMYSDYNNRMEISTRATGVRSYEEFQEMMT